jgi:hypothetical protein
MVRGLPFRNLVLDTIEYLWFLIRQRSRVDVTSDT